MAELTKNLRSAYQKGYTLGAQLRLRAVKARGPSLADKAGRSSLRREFNWALLETGDLIQSKHLKEDDQNRESARASQHQDHISIGSEQFHRHVFSFSISTNSFSCHAYNPFYLALQPTHPMRLIGE